MTQASMTKHEAEKAGKKLVALLGAGWKYRVWENIGWHFEAHIDDGTPFGRLRVFGSHGGEFGYSEPSWHALLNSDGEGAYGEPAWSPPPGPDPVAVAAAAVALAKKEMDGIRTLLELLPAKFGGNA